MISLNSPTFHSPFYGAVVFYVWGQLEKRNQDVVIELELGEGIEVVADVGE